MKIKWTLEDLAEMRRREFMAGLASLPEKTRRKICHVLCATSSQADFRNTFQEDRIMFFAPVAQAEGGDK
jgi:hypothetical protein